MIIISTSLAMRGQPSPRFHVEAWLPFRKYEKDYDIIHSTTGRPTTHFVLQEPCL